MAGGLHTVREPSKLNDAVAWAAQRFTELGPAVVRQQKNLLRTAESVPITPLSGATRAMTPRRTGGWGALGLGLFRAFVEADASRVSSPEHVVVVAPGAVGSAGHGAGLTGL